ncbi:MAG: LPS assembly protein LptD, partial [Gammaproteobacteria bacterium]
PTPPAAAAPEPRAPAVATPAAAASPEPGPSVPFTLSDADDAVSTTRDIDAGIDWSQCAGPRPVSATVMAGASQGAELVADADAVVMDETGQAATLRGNVHLTDGTQELFADQVTYERATDVITAAGDVLVRRPEGRIAGQRAAFERRTDHARIEQVEYRIPSARGRGTADVAEFLGNAQSRYENITFTTCRPGNEDWLLSAGTLEVDHAEGLATADNAVLEFKNVPIGYLPTFTFPIDDRRRSGFLLPSGGYSSKNGLDLKVPYYFNLAPNYDATFAPRYLSKRGLMLGGEARLLTDHYRSELFGEIIPNDREFEEGGARGAGALRAAALDFGSNLSTTSITHLERAGELRYRGDDWGLLGRLQYYQTVDRATATANRPYARLPQLAFTFDRPSTTGLRYLADGEYVYFHRKDSTVGHRVDVKPGVSLPLRQVWGFLEPKVQARYTAYRLDDQEVAGLTDASPDRLLGIFSLDGGLYFDRNTEWFGTALRQTLEPRLYYLYVPDVDQDDLPVFDTTALDFNAGSLFRDNRFNGPDRQGDANQLTLYVGSSTLADATGAEVLRVGAGQILYFADREVTLPGAAVEDDATSSLVGDIAVYPAAGWELRAIAEWNPHDSLFEQALAEARYRGRDGRALYASYRLRDAPADVNDVDQTDLAFVWPIGDRTRVIGRWNYSLIKRESLESAFGIEYGECCWRTRAIVQQYVDGADDDKNLAFLLQLELYGLGQLGNDIDEFLKERIYGYR